MRTSPRTVVRMVLRMTAQCQLLPRDASRYIKHTVPLDVYHGSSVVSHVGGVRQPMPRAEAGPMLCGFESRRGRLSGGVKTAEESGEQKGAGAGCMELVAAGRRVTRCDHGCCGRRSEVPKCIT